jgi:hypothetical protein
VVFSTLRGAGIPENGKLGLKSAKISSEFQFFQKILNKTMLKYNSYYSDLLNILLQIHFQKSIQSTKLIANYDYTYLVALLILFTLQNFGFYY